MAPRLAGVVVGGLPHRRGGADLVDLVMTDHALRSSADAFLMCWCGRKLVTPLRLGSGNDLTVELPDEWYLAYVGEWVIVRCPSHSGGPRQ